MKSSNNKFRLNRTYQSILVALGVSLTSTAFAADDDSNKEQDKKEVERITVTGSRLIDDPTLTTRQVTIIDREVINNSGAGSISELLQILPQNINAVTNVGAGFTDSVGNLGLGSNVFGGSAANLRGLGEQYTLILIDGRRPAKGGVFGDVYDLTSIPLERVERLEILFDGAAAIYGSDAVGGVINVITRKDYEGTEVSVSISGTEDGGGERKRFSLGHTVSLGSGSLSLNAGYNKTGEINTSDRQNLDFVGAFTFPLPPQTPGVIGNGENAIFWVRDVNGDGDYDDVELNERLTGSQEYQYEFFPGFSTATPIPRAGLGNVRSNIINGLSEEQKNEINSHANQIISDGYSPVYYAVLPEYNDRALTLYDIPYNLPAGASAQQQFEALGKGSVSGFGQSVTPEEESYNFGFDFDYELTETLYTRMSASWTRNEQTSNIRPAGEDLNIAWDNPNNPLVTELDYAYVSGLTQEQNEVTRDTFSANITLDWDISDDWKLQINTSHATSETRSEYVNSLYDPSRIAYYDGIEESFGGTFAGLLRGRETLSFDKDGDGLRETFVRLDHGNVHFHDPLLGFDNFDAFQKAVVNPYYNTETETETNEFELFLQGRLYKLPAGDITTNLVASRREDSSELLNRNNSIRLTDILAGRTNHSLNETTEENITSFGGEISVPVFGNDYKLPFVESLAFHAAYRTEDVNYMNDDATNWSLGFNYSPADWLVVRLNHTDSKVLPSAHLINGGASLTSANRIQDCTNPDACVFIRNWEHTIFTLRGPVEDLGPEQSIDTAVSFEFKPFDSTSFAVTYTDKEITDQIGSPGNFTSLTLQNLDTADSDPFLTRVTPNTQVLGLPFAQVVEAAGLETLSFPREPVVAKDGDYLQDRRRANVGAQNVETLDFNFNWRSGETEYGYFLVNWSHNRFLKNAIVQNNVCRQENVTCGFNQPNESEFLDNLFGEVDVVGSINRREFELGGGRLTAPATPRDTGSLSVNWNYKGLSVGARTNYQSNIKTLDTWFWTNLQGERVGNNVTYEYQPARSLDLSFTLDLGRGLFEVPKWLESTTVYLTLDDIYRKDERTKVIWENGEPDNYDNREQNSRFLRPRGTNYTLRFNTRF